MSTTIFTANDYNPHKARKRRQWLIGILSAVVILGGLFYIFRNWTYERRVDKFFTAIEQKDYKQAYGIWQNDPAWEQHPNQHAGYLFNEFYRDWGPGGEWGLIRSHRIEGSTRPKGGSGVIVVVKINDRVEPARLWVEKKDKTLTWSPM
jgi:hypothetical protein